MADSPINGGARRGRSFARARAGTKDKDPGQLLGQVTTSKLLRAARGTMRVADRIDQVISLHSGREINGIQGSFMLDTGMEEALVINDHRIPLMGGEKIGKGSFGSGQTYDVWMRSAIDSVAIGPLRFSQLHNIQSQNASMLEEITPDFNGFIGFDFWKTHLLLLDYKRLTATFYRDRSDGDAAVAAALAQSASSRDGSIRYEESTEPSHR